jgi:RbsD / FucU transport protein family
MSRRCLPCLGRVSGTLADHTAAGRRGEEAAGATRIKLEEGTTVRAYKGQRTAAGRESEASPRNRCQDREQRARAVGRITHRKQNLDQRHLIRQARWPAITFWRCGTHERAALRRGQGTQHQRSFWHEQGPAGACAGPLTIALAAVLRRCRCPRGHRGLTGDTSTIRQDFYARCRDTFGVILTSEARPYGCFLLVKGVIANTR